MFLAIVSYSANSALCTWAKVSMLQIWLHAALLPSLPKLEPTAFRIELDLLPRFPASR